MSDDKSAPPTEQDDAEALPEEVRENLQKQAPPPAPIPDPGPL
ncbi:hypothetical protein ACX0MV_15695 [Pseudomonas borbori]